MSKFLKITIITVLLMFISIPVFATDNRFKKIECEMYCKTTSGNLYREDITKQIFVIDDIYKNLYIYSDGQQAPVTGDVVIFNENEISYKNLKTLQKEFGELNINRQSGSIHIQLTKPNIWIGDMTTEYQGTCHKLEGNKF